MQAQERKSDWFKAYERMSLQKYINGENFCQGILLKDLKHTERKKKLDLQTKPQEFRTRCRRQGYFAMPYLGMMKYCLMEMEIKLTSRVLLLIYLVAMICCHQKTSQANSILH